MQAFANSSNPFADFMLSLFSRDVLLMDAVSQIAWVDGKDDSKGYLLVRVLPRSEESFEDIRELLVQGLEDAQEDAPFPFRCSGQAVQDSTGRRNMLVKLWQKVSSPKRPQPTSNR